jgi:hypothetical protein
MDLDYLVLAVENAEDALTKRALKPLLSRARNARKHAQRGNYQSASNDLESLIGKTDRTNFDTNVGFNHEGNIISRADHIRFTLDEKIISDCGGKKKKKKKSKKSKECKKSKKSKKSKKKK